MNSSKELDLAVSEIVINIFKIYLDNCEQMF